MVARAAHLEPHPGDARRAQSVDEQLKHGACHQRFIVYKIAMFRRVAGNYNGVAALPDGHPALFAQGAAMRCKVVFFPVQDAFRVVGIFKQLQMGQAAVNAQAVPPHIVQQMFLPACVRARDQIKQRQDVRQGTDNLAIHRERHDRRLPFRGREIQQRALVYRPDFQPVQMPVDFLIKRRFAAGLEDKPDRLCRALAERLPGRAQGRLPKQPPGARGLGNNVSRRRNKDESRIVCPQHLKDQI